MTAAALQPPTVAVRASAERDAAPDSFVVSARVGVEGADSAAAASALAGSYAILEAAVAGLTHLDLDVERGAVSLYPHKFPARRRPTVWHAHRGLTITGRDTSQVAELAGALDGLHDTAIEGPHWQVREDNPVHAQVEADAVRAAIARAARYAAALGGTLGRLVELSDPGMGGGGRMHYATDMSAAAGSGESGLEAMDFEPHDIEVSAMVEGRWYLVLPD